jgi:hypothetical protein
LELAPRTTHLFDAVLVRLEALFARRRMSSRRCGAGTVCDDYDVNAALDDRGHDDLLANLSRLKRDAVIGHGGNVNDRAHALDPETWAGEVHRAEHARLDVTGRFSRVLDQAAEALERRRPPIFVLVIDNLDLSPSRTLTMIRLLKQLRAPRIFYLVFGDIDHLEYVLRANTAKEWGEAGMGDMILDREEERSRMAETVRRHARQILDRFVPRSDRVRLE